MDLTFRATTPDDEEFLMQVFASYMAERLAEANSPVLTWAELITQQFKAQHYSYRTNFPKSTFEIVLVDGEKAGRLYLDRREDEIRILDLILLPAFRGQGIGTKLLEGLFDEACKTRKKVGAHVDHGCRAMNLALRLGFSAQLETEGTTLMMWDPDTVLLD